MVENVYLALVERFCIDGQLPACPSEVLVGAIVLAVCSRNEWRDQPRAVFDVFERNITDAVREFRARQTVADNMGKVGTHWKN